MTQPLPSSEPPPLTRHFSRTVVFAPAPPETWVALVAAVEALRNDSAPWRFKAPHYLVRLSDAAGTTESPRLADLPRLLDEAELPVKWLLVRVANRDLDALDDSRALYMENGRKMVRDDQDGLLYVPSLEVRITGPDRTSVEGLAHLVEKLRDVRSFGRRYGAPVLPRVASDAELSNRSAAVRAPVPSLSEASPASPVSPEARSPLRAFWSSPWAPQIVGGLLVGLVLLWLTLRLGG